MTYNIRPDKALCFSLFAHTAHSHRQTGALSHTDKHTQLMHCILVIYHNVITVSPLRHGSTSNYNHQPGHCVF